MDTSPPPAPSTPQLTPGVKLQDCIEELLKFTLTSIMQTKLHSSLSNAYCANLLRDDPSSPLLVNHEVFKGVPSYPLYKRLAFSLYESIYSGAICLANEQHILVHADLSFKKNEWNKLIVEEGPALLTMDSYADGLKTIEGRCAVGDYRRIKTGDLILLNKCVMLQVQDVRQYALFCEMLEAENLTKVLPGVKSIEEGVQIYRNFYSEEKESSNGVLAICVMRLTSQLYGKVASILSGLSCEGVQKLLGFVQTMGTIPELLPPPPSMLLSTFLALHNPHVKGSTLTDGARALAKHVSRSSKGYWGTLCGSDSEKNRHSVDVISHLLTHCTWLNMHIVPPHGIVFEIRIAEGYGARWSEDGTKFIGFLEPYMVDGHSKGWKH